MPRVGRHWSVLSGVALCAILGGQVGVAQASDKTLRATLNGYAPKIAQDENAVKRGLKGYPHSGVTPLVRALNNEVADLHALRSRLKNDSASSTRGAVAKTNIVTGLGLIASAYEALRTDVEDAHGAPIPAAQVNAAVKTDKQGRSKLLAGLKVLG